MEKVTAESTDFDQEGQSAVSMSLVLSFSLSLELHLCIWAFFICLFVCLFHPSPCKPEDFFLVSVYSEKISANLCVTNFSFMLYVQQPIRVMAG